MTLGLSTSNDGGGFLPIIIYDARAGRLFKVERAQGPTGWESNRVDITSPAPTFLLDFGSIEVGVVRFAPTGPDFITVPYGQPLPIAPTKEYKRCFRAKVASKNLGVREFSHSANCVLGAIDALHTEFEQAPEAAQGKIPAVQLSGTKAVPTNTPQGKTTNYAPVFTITGWADRIAEFGERTVPAPGPRPKTNGAGAQHVPPPVQPGGAASTPSASAVPDEMPF